MHAGVSASPLRDVPWLQVRCPSVPSNRTTPRSPRPGGKFRPSLPGESTSNRRLNAGGGSVVGLNIDILKNNEPQESSRVFFKSSDSCAGTVSPLRISGGTSARPPRAGTPCHLPLRGHEPLGADLRLTPGARLRVGIRMAKDRRSGPIRWITGWWSCPTFAIPPMPRDSASVPGRGAAGPACRPRRDFL